ncbi:DNA-directed RNA polymerase III subunit RPC4 [Anoplolepis gracilipes]|uniref:DNA-directed RNA polymerase III subunit RPC4 n=1 Tax=Anoplolepis gracilipes TaxID=354296 RepID=UPI003B9F8DE3
MPGTQRLTSYRLPRDLTLGGNIKPERPKKVYTPNLNVQRNKKKDEVTPAQVDVTKPKEKDRGRGRGNARGRGRGDGRHGREKGNIIQSVGIWSEGIHSVPTVSRRSYGSSSSNSTGPKNYLEKSKLNINKFTNNADEEKFKDLLHNDFDDINPDEKMDPIVLPRIIKEEFNDEEIDKKPVILENGEVVNIKEEPSSEKIKKEITISQIIENKSNPYVLMQFPDCWQDLEFNKEESKPKVSNDLITHNENENDNKAKNEHRGLNSLKNGLLGKLEILKSGKARLCIGNNYFSVDTNVQDFQQELLAAKVNTVSLTGDLVNLGPVNNQLVCLPDLETMLKNS